MIPMSNIERLDQANYCLHELTSAKHGETTKSGEPLYLASAGPWVWRLRMRISVAIGLWDPMTNRHGNWPRHSARMCL